MKRMLGILVAMLVLCASNVQAGMIASDAAIQPSGERARVKAMLERPDVAKELQKMGIAPGDAEARVKAMSDSEVAQLAGRLDALPAGGALTNQELMLIIIIILVVALVL
ncbi:MAG TPA: PA2779 family protein [Burkholderiales bacterium]|jgi:hypothetical protein|nr:PA2779 family protein [Burkholderiales bacterium]